MNLDHYPVESITKFPSVFSYGPLDEEPNIPKKLRLSNIFVWTQDDFGGNETGVLIHQQKYVKGNLANSLMKMGRKSNITMIAD